VGIGTGVPAAEAGSCGSSQGKLSSAKADSGPDIVDTAVAAGDFETLVAAVQAAGLVDALKGEGPFTVFAPNDAAFAALPEGTVENLLKPENRNQLTAILTYHVVPGRVDAEAASSLDEGATLNGQRIDLDFANGELTVDGAKVIAADIETSNGLIHVIDRVLLPSEGEDQAAAAQEMIRMAIRSGAPLYNHGQPMACTAIYSVTAKCLMSMENLPPQCRQALRNALVEAEDARDVGRKAWIMRDALDIVYEELGEMEVAMK
jgi:uncharacterized surface protein with fasciclin (FAS1) repeats